MPAKVDPLRVPRIKGIDKRIKLTNTQIEWVKENPEGWGSLKIANHLGVSKKLIQMIRDPEKAARSKQLFAERRKDGRYYNKEAHRKQTQQHREHKRSLLRDKVICFSETRESERQNG